MAAAKRLYNATTAYEGKDTLRRPDNALLQQAEATAVAQARDAFGSLASVELSALLKATKLEFTAFESAVRSSIGLGAYPPYQEFLRDVRKINEALARELTPVNMTKLESPEGPSSSKKPATYGPEMTYTSFVALVEMGLVKSVEIREDIVEGVVAVIPTPSERHPEWKNIGPDRRFWSRVPSSLQSKIVERLKDKRAEVRFRSAEPGDAYKMGLAPAGEEAKRLDRTVKYAWNLEGEGVRYRCNGDREIRVRATYDPGRSRQREAQSGSLANNLTYYVTQDPPAPRVL